MRASIGLLIRNILFSLLIIPSFGNAQIQAQLGDKKIFTDIVLADSIEVRISEIKVSSSGQLVTSSLGPCSALAVLYNGKMLLSHVSPADKSERIVSALNEFTKDVQDLRQVKVYVLPGWTMSTLSLSIIFGSLIDANLINHAVFFESILNPFDTFGINESGPIYIKSERTP